MTIRKRIKKWLYGHCPGLAGAFPYFGTKVYFPKDSLLFRAACEQGIWEPAITNLLCALVRPGTVYFDVGANIGLMAIPVLRACPTCTVASLEPSPATLASLRQTAARSEYRDRWRIIGKAASSMPGTNGFYVAADGLGAYDGLCNTGRVGPMSRIDVPVTTIDCEWQDLGRPEVSLIKIDVEGAEIQVLEGALDCIEQSRPYLIVELNNANLAAHQHEPEHLLEMAAEVGYDVCALPSTAAVISSAMLRVQMASSENFLLAPKQQVDRSPRQRQERGPGYGTVELARSQSDQR